MVKDRPAERMYVQKANEIDSSQKVARSGRGKKAEQDGWLVDAVVYMSFCEGTGGPLVLGLFWTTVVTSSRQISANVLIVPGFTWDETCSSPCQLI